MTLEPVGLSDKAIEEVRLIMTNKKIPAGYMLRVGVKGAGCGVGFQLGFDKKKDSDLHYKVGDIDVLVDKKHTMYLIGLTVDFYEGSDSRGFTFVKEGTSTDEP